MIINTYDICSQIANSLKTKTLAGIETNEIQKYSDENFGKKCRIYNQVAIDKNGYVKPYISVSTIAQKQKQKNIIGIDIDFAIPIEEIREEIVDDVVIYRDRNKLSEFANIIISIIEKLCINYESSEIVFLPNPIEFDKEEYSGNIEITFETSILLKKG